MQVLQRRQARRMRKISMSSDRGGHLYMQTNETKNAVVHYRWSASGTLTEVERVPTGGPDHVRLMSVERQGKLTARPEQYTVNTKDKTDRVPTMAVLSPDGKFLLVGTTFDQPIAHTGLYPDGSPILWVGQPDGTFKVIASNAPDPDGLIVFPVR